MFDGRRQLILYRFFFEEGVDGWPDAGCPGCSSFADGIPELGLLHARDITFAMASPAPQANLRRYAERMGWTDVPWYTIRTERFSADFGVDEWFGLNVFLRDGDDVYRTYFLQHGPMVQKIGSVWSMFSLTPVRRAVRRRGRARGLAAGAVFVLVPPSRRVRRSAAVGRRMTADLDIHPLVVLVVTALGGLLGGIVGLMLAVRTYVIAADAISRARSRGVFEQVAQRAQPTVQQVIELCGPE